jgi:hypothetical protein
MKFIFHIREKSFLFNKNWYSMARWKNPDTFEGRKGYIIDFGIICFGYSVKEKK